MKHLGIHLDVAKTRAVLFDLNKNEGKILATGEFDNPDGMIVDGEVVSFPLLVEHMKFIRKRFGRVNATLAVSHKSCICTIVRVPEMPEDELRKTIEYEMERFIKKGVLSDYVWNWMIVNEEIVEVDQRRIKYISALVVGFPKMQIVQILGCAKKAGLHITCIEAQDVALWRSCVAQSQLNYISMHVGYNEVQVATSHRGNLHYIRPKASVNTSLIFGDHADIAFNTFVEELRRTSEYYIDKTKSRADCVLVTSSQEVPDEFIKLLDSNMSIPVKKWDVQNEFVLNNTRIVCNADEIYINETFAVALGLALRTADESHNTIDLIPKDYVRKNRISQVVKISLGTGAILLMLVGSFAFYVHLLENKLSDLMKERNSVQAELDRATALQNDIESLRMQISTIEQMQADGGTAKKDQTYGIAVGDFMHYIEKNIPRDVKLHNLHYDSMTNRIRMKTIADSQQSLGSFMLLLEKLENVTEVSTTQIREYKFGNISYLASEIEVKIGAGGAAR